MKGHIHTDMEQKETILEALFFVQINFSFDEIQYLNIIFQSRNLSLQYPSSILNDKHFMTCQITYSMHYVTNEN